MAHGVLVFDDLHRVDDPAFFDFLDRLLERLSPRWTVAVATRHDPPLALARLRVAGELAEFRQVDLQLSEAEVRALVTAQGQHATQAESPHERTQGWAAGLRLALTSGTAAGDSNKLIARAFDLSPHTVKRHVANILDKLDAGSRTQAAAWYLTQPGA